MPKPLKNQWEFGDLFATPPPAKSPVAPPLGTPLASSLIVAKRVFSVTELTTHVKRLLESQIGTIHVTGEITNFRCYPSGHFYFTLKDNQSQLGCVLFQNSAKLVSRTIIGQLKDGEKVTLNGNLSVYEARGQYQLVVTHIELQGLGALQAAFEQLKQKLQAEGLFESGRKRALPRYPVRIGLVTSAQGAAIRDVLNVIARRQPSLEIVLAACRVQGDLAAGEIVGSVRMLNKWSTTVGQPLDLILLTRGGGSLEDLWAFNTEAVARAIVASRVPVISAVGHEVDFTISDFVADLRAATPSVAAELITEGAFSSRTTILNTGARMRQIVRQTLRWHREELAGLVARYERTQPRRRLQTQAQRLDDSAERLRRLPRRRLGAVSVQVNQLGRRVSAMRPLQKVQRLQKDNDQLFQRLRNSLRPNLQMYRQQIDSLRVRLELLSPVQVLRRGYSMTWNSTTGRLIRNASEATAGDKLRTILGEGEVQSIVDQIPGTSAP